MLGPMNALLQLQLRLGRVPSNTTATSSRFPSAMRLPFEILVLAFTHIASSATLSARSASFDSLLGLTTLPYDHSREETGEQADKYFHEATFDRHYDGRFAGTELPLETRTWHLRLLLKTYIETMERIGVRTWIMHGCLLGWFWNGRIMPWDNDVDVMVEERGIQELGHWWNMTVHHFSGRDLGLLDEPADAQQEESAEELDKGQLIAAEAAKMNRATLIQQVVKEGKKYLLEVNPHYTNTSTVDKYNHIDARWIDTSTGLYIDITALHPAPPKRPLADPLDPDDNNSAKPPLQFFSKDNHAYTSTDLFPLRPTTFESIAVKIPYDYNSILIEEYGTKALTRTWYRAMGADGYGFDGQKKEWVKQEFRFSDEAKALREAEGRGLWGLLRWAGGRRGKGGKRRKEKTVEDILEGREGELIDEEEEEEEEGFAQFGGI
ncbi:hypothetical protein LEMA_P069340.1 [Plenodomus lingam JN3]|uniref:LicD/FKTN/FKRP nucleotidyltransferase domain-containing protein n=1 Tax=Leptosphaeria maculans (strain JN3 / isolate v23.1.3 / race Av1-4-5-6-7-8) TaxID=985895 RepID=E4ZJZ1_LEPMJ|nr:hypothetical protein LEMA_P069340.1 [Plenodomus lingam JN3]CBX91426.1 hypothetical protein LEMA_P069340.1 [Plenodomus lingam JN3]